MSRPSTLRALPSTALLPGLVVPVGVILLDWPIAVVLGVFVLEIAAVVYDRLLEEPQARLERAAVTDLEVTTDAVDRVFDTRTVSLGGMDDDDTPSFRTTVPDPEELEGDDANANESLSLVHVRDHRRLVDALGVTWRLDASSDSASG